MADIPTHPDALLLQYADDTSVSFTYGRVQGVQSKINNFLCRLVTWMKDFKFLLNADKTELIHFVGSIKHVTSYRRKQLTKLELVVDRAILTPKASIKYLGVHFSNNNRANLHINKSIIKAKSSKALLQHLLHNQLIDVKFKGLLYTLYLRPILSYACPMWLNPTNVSSFQVEKLRAIERQLIRTSLNIFRRRHSYRYLPNRDLFRIYNKRRIDVLMTDLSVRFHERCASSSNPLVIKYINDCVDADAFGHVAKHFAGSKLLFNLHARENLFDRDGRLTLFNRRHLSPEEEVYCVDQ